MLHYRRSALCNGPIHRQVAGARQAQSASARQGPRRVVVARASNFYEVLGVEADASVDDIKQAFRRKAREIHPDVNREDGADQAFMECKEAYETLVDTDRRREYDRLNRLGRRVGFFQDVVEEPGVRTSPFRWSQVGSEPDPWPRRTPGHAPGRGFDEYGDEEDGDEEGDSAGPSRQRDGDVDPEERLRELWQFMERAGGGPGGLRQWSTGGNPWGTSTSDMWRRQVDQQTRDPYSGRGGSWRGGRLDRNGGFPGGTEWAPPGRSTDGSEWEDDPATRRQNWRPPGREEWRPRRPDDDEPQDRTGCGRRGWGDDGGFRGKPL